MVVKITKTTTAVSVFRDSVSHVHCTFHSPWLRNHSHNPQAEIPVLTPGNPNASGVGYSRCLELCLLYIIAKQGDIIRANASIHLQSARYRWPDLFLTFTLMSPPTACPGCYHDTLQDCLTLSHQHCFTYHLCFHIYSNIRCGQTPPLLTRKKNPTALSTSTQKKPPLFLLYSTTQYWVAGKISEAAS